MTFIPIERFAWVGGRSSTSVENATSLLTAVFLNSRHDSKIVTVSSEGRAHHCGSDLIVTHFGSSYGPERSGREIGRERRHGSSVERRALRISSQIASIHPHPGDGGRSGPTLAMRRGRISDSDRKTQSGIDRVTGEPLAAPVRGERPRSGPESSRP